MIKIKPCPLCGNEAEIYFYDYIGDNFAPYHSIECTNNECGCSIDVDGEDSNKAVVVWNNRAIND